MWIQSPVTPGPKLGSSRPGDSLITPYVGNSGLMSWTRWSLTFHSQMMFPSMSTSISPSGRES